MLRSIGGVGGVGILTGAALMVPLLTSPLSLTPAVPAAAKAMDEANVDAAQVAGSPDDEVDSEDVVEAAQSLPPHDDSRLDSVSVEPVLPIDIVLPICMPIAFIGFVSASATIV